MRGSWGSFLCVLKVVRVCWDCMVLSGFGALGGAGGGGTPFTAQNEEGSADSSKTEGTPPGGVIFGSSFGPQMWHIFMVFTMRSRGPKGGQKVVLLGSYLR